MDIELFTTPGLGDTSYLVASGGEAALVDPQRDAWRFLAVAEERGWRVRHVLETHVHNDYLSGALEARAATGARIAAPAQGGYAFEHDGAEEGTAIELGGLRLVAMATPGHTPEHLAWAIHDADATPDTPPSGVFTGGSLLVGTAGRTDLLGTDRTEELTRLQEASLRRLAALPGDVRVLPTHGAGSFCSAGPATSNPSSTIGAERFANPVLRALDGSDFAGALLGGLGRYPSYYARMAPINRAGPLVLGGPASVPPMSVERFATAMSGGARVVDGRDRRSYAAAHIPGSLNIELDDDFPSYVGWLVPFDAPIVLVLPGPGPAAAAEAAVEAAVGLSRVGYEHVAGYLAGGLEAWSESGRPVGKYPTTTIQALYDEARRDADRDGAEPRTDLLDVRQPNEWRDDGVIPGSRTIFVADLPARLAELPRDHEITVLCKAGSRASIAASLLAGAGIPVRLVARGGATGWAPRFAALQAPGSAVLP